MRTSWIRLLPLAAASLGCLVSSIAHAQRTFAEINPVDAIPRDRLVTDRELVSLLDPGLPALQPVRRALASGDTIQALQQLVQYLRQRSAPRYFFTPGEVRERAAAFARRYPAAVTKVRRDVQTFKTQYGADVDWMMPGRNRQGTPHDPNTIRTLARQWQAENIALSYYLGQRDRAQIDFLMEHVRDFVRDYEAGRAETGANDVFERFYAGHRMRNWLLAHHLLLGTPEYRWQDQVLMLKVFLLHGARVVDQSLKFSWGNHQLHGLAGLYEVSVMYPELPVMRAWNQQALKLLVEHLEKEIEEDGFQFERASHYHLLDILNYFRVYQISQLNNIDLPAFYPERFRKMFDAVVALSMPNQRLPIIQDVSDSTWVMVDPPQQEMSIGAMLFTEPTYKFLAADVLPASLYWFFDAGAPDRYAGIRARAPTVGSVALPQSKYYVMRSGWDPNDLYLLVDGGLAKHKPDHTHGGVLGVIGYGFGEQFLPNYSVLYRDPSYPTVKNSLTKSVALADNVLQGRGWIDNTARTGFGIWEFLPTPTVHEWISGSMFDYFAGSHNGFQDTGVSYSRAILFMKPNYWLFIDHFEGERAHAFQQIWQGAYAAGSHNWPGRYSHGTGFNPNRAIQEGKTARLAILQADPSGMEVETKRYYYTQSVQFEKKGEKQYRFITLVHPSSKTQTVAPRIQQFERPEFREIAVYDGSRRDQIFVGKRPEFSLAGVASNAAMLALRYDSDALRSVLMHNGSRVTLTDFQLEMADKATVELARQPSGAWQISLLQGAPQQLQIRWPDGTTAQVDLRPGAAQQLPARTNR